jgi:hypothetical protein
LRAFLLLSVSFGGISFEFVVLSSSRCHPLGRHSISASSTRGRSSTIP